MMARLIRSTCHALRDSHWIDRSALTQLYRAGTSVGANVREAKYAESRRDFIHKLKIAEKELAETLYWVGLLSSHPGIINAVDRKELLEEIRIVRSLLRSIVRSSKTVTP
ncbi:MAG: four helix bundle protein [Ignavibacteria bacterium]|nr:four helix bundle protein [Ignavibacteria bacterium]MBP6510453.1 four helix bundle protein [Candidatus Kapabacteria bacterium]MBK6417642.1 four helix bundle protein [Ignavibacteria bacterium]MBK6418045.1 four helix bundle protein [Ignavibacteria bacterium]MBK7186515.1 four helix bundle protein [Ignavibacteria bacterium]